MSDIKIIRLDGQLGIYSWTTGFVPTPEKRLQNRRVFGSSENSGVKVVRRLRKNESDAGSVKMGRTRARIIRK